MQAQTSADEAAAIKQAKMKPTINGSTYVKPQQLEWQKTQFDKVWLKVLYENKDKGESTVLVKLEPGAHLPYHKHPELEQAYVLEGSMYDHDGTCSAGEYVWRKPGSLHENHSDTGAIVLAVYRKQNIFVNKTTGYTTQP
ncbi:MAG: cupin domain-containing protein [Burkholderiales bacterium]|nr:cupin domain-containing protein [Burkholderiales bacterium]